MIRFASLAPCFVLLAAGAAGCYGADPNAELSPPNASINSLEGRYALGSRATVVVRGGSAWTLESSDPLVVRVDRLGEGIADLSFVGAGHAALVLEDGASVIERDVEVVAPQASQVLLSEFTEVPVGQLSDETLLAWKQYVLVMYLDADGAILTTSSSFKPMKQSSRPEPGCRSTSSG